MITAEQALASLPGRQQNRGWSIPTLTETIRRVSDEQAVYIFNVSPFMWIRPQGGMGTFVIPPCKEGARYSEARKIPGIPTETVVVDEAKMTREQYDGFAVAKDIVGYGDFREKSDDLRKYGVFVSRFSTPEENEIEAAEEMRDAHYSGLVAEGNRLYENNGGVDSKTGASNIGPQHIQAAKALGVNPAWSRKAVRLAECPACGESVKPNAAMCNHCDAVLDETKARKFFPHKFASEPERRGPGRPRNEAV